jgi:selenocysteine-specific translation elongation factor
MPYGKDIVIKSIQMHDDPVDESKSPARVGLAIKGITAEQISRGDILCSSDSHVKIISSPVPTTTEAASTSTTSHAKFVKNPYYKGNLAENQTSSLVKHTCF